MKTKKEFVKSKSTVVKVPFLMGAVFLLCATSTFAGLTLSIDQANEEVYFSGQTTGTMMVDDFFGYAYVQWTDSSGGYQKYISGIENSLDLTVDSSFEPNFEFAVTKYDVSGTTTTGLRFKINDNDYWGDLALTVSGNETRVSYAGLDQEYKNILEGYSSSDTIPLGDGTGFDAVSIDAVPEPATAGLLAGAGLLLALYRRSFR